MPIISMFYGIVVSMYFFDTNRHKAPHVHVAYQDEEAVYSIPDGRLLDGRLPPAKAKLVRAWIEIHQEDLVADWKLAAAGRAVFKIEPLK